MRRLFGHFRTEKNRTWVIETQSTIKPQSVAWTPKRQKLVGITRRVRFLAYFAPVALVRSGVLDIQSTTRVSAHWSTDVRTNRVCRSAKAPAPAPCSCTLTLNSTSKNARMAGFHYRLLLGFRFSTNFKHLDTTKLITLWCVASLLRQKMDIMYR